MVFVFDFDMGLFSLETGLLYCRLWFGVMRYKVRLSACVYIHVCMHIRTNTVISWFTSLIFGTRQR